MKKDGSGRSLKLGNKVYKYILFGKAVKIKSMSEKLTIFIKSLYKSGDLVTDHTANINLSNLFFSSSVPSPKPLEFDISNHQDYELLQISILHNGKCVSKFYSTLGEIRNQEGNYSLQPVEGAGPIQGEYPYKWDLDIRVSKGDLEASSRNPFENYLAKSQNIQETRKPEEDKPHIGKIIFFSI